MKIILNLDSYELRVLRDTLEEEIDRNGKDYAEISNICRGILKQVLNETLIPQG